MLTEKSVVAWWLLAWLTFLFSFACWVSALSSNHCMHISSVIPFGPIPESRSITVWMKFPTTGNAMAFVNNCTSTNVTWRPPASTAPSPLYTRVTPIRPSWNLISTEHICNLWFLLLRLVPSKTCLLSLVIHFTVLYAYKNNTAF